MVRRSMDAAEVKPPRGTWRAVDARLGHGRGAFRPVRLAALSACTAVACMALGVLHLSRHHSMQVEEAYFAHNSVPMGSTPPMPYQAALPSPGVLREGPLRVESPSGPGQGGGMAVPSPAGTDIAGAGVSHEADTVSAYGTESVPEASGARDGASGLVAAEETGAGLGFGGDFAFGEDGKAGRGVSRLSVITVSGLIGANDNTSSSIVSRRMAVSGGSKHSKTISQSGESSYSIPVSFGVGLRCHVSGNLSVGTGLQYSMLRRTFDGTYTRRDADDVIIEQINAKVANTQQYIGVPISFYYDVVSRNDISTYVFCSGVFERAVGNRYRVSGVPDVLVKDKKRGLQTSAAIGFGISFNVSRNVGIYLDPSLTYYFDCRQPVSIRTQQPLQFSFSAGMRFRL